MVCTIAHAPATSSCMLGMGNDMVKRISRVQVAAAWIAGVVVLLGCSVVAGLQITTNAAELWLVAAVMPPAVMLLLWHPAPPVTVAELLHGADASPRDDRRS